MQQDKRKQHYEDNKDYFKTYYEINKSKILEKKRQRYKENKEANKIII